MDGVKMPGSAGTRLYLSPGLRSTWWYFRGSRMFIMSEMAMQVRLSSGAFENSDPPLAVYLGTRLFFREKIFENLPYSSPLSYGPHAGGENSSTPPRVELFSECKFPARPVNGFLGIGGRGNRIYGEMNLSAELFSLWGGLATGWLCSRLCAYPFRPGSSIGAEYSGGRRHVSRFPGIRHPAQRNDRALRQFHTKF